MAIEQQQNDDFTVEELREKLSSAAGENFSKSGIVKYKRELEEDTELSIHTVRDRSMRLPSVRAKWNGYLAEEKNQLKHLLVLRQQRVAKTAGQTLDAREKFKLTSKPDEILKKIDALKNELELIIEFIQGAINILAGMGYDIKNYIEVIKMENS